MKRILFLFLLIGSFLYAGNSGIVESKSAIGCETKEQLSDAYDAFMRGGLTAFVTYNRNQQCLVLFDGAKVEILKIDMPHYKILYKNPYGKHRIFWVSYDVIKK